MDTVPHTVSRGYSGFAFGCKDFLTTQVVVGQKECCKNDGLLNDRCQDGSPSVSISGPSPRSTRCVWIVLSHSNGASTLPLSETSREIELAIIFSRVACHCNHPISRNKVALINPFVFCSPKCSRYASALPRQKPSRCPYL